MAKLSNDYIRANSGLTPASSYSLADHAEAFYGGVGSVADRKLAWLHAQTGLTGSIADLDSQLGVVFAAPVGPLVGPVTHLNTVLGGQTTRTGANTVSISKPAEASQGTFLVAEFGMAPQAADGTGTSLVRAITPPTGWTLLVSGSDTGTPGTQYAAYYYFAGANEPASWSWSFDGPSNTVSQLRVFSGVNVANPIAASNYTPTPATATTRVTGTITTTEQTFICYSTDDRNASNPVAPDAGTALNVFQTSSASLTTARAGLQPAGSYSKTLTGAASTSNAGNIIYALRSQS